MGAAHDAWRRRNSLQTARITANTLQSFGVDRDVTDFAREAGSARPKFAVENDRAPDAVSDRHVEKVACASPAPTLNSP